MTNLLIRLSYRDALTKQEFAKTETSVHQVSSTMGTGAHEHEVPLMFKAVTEGLQQAIQEGFAKHLTDEQKRKSFVVATGELIIDGTSFTARQQFIPDAAARLYAGTKIETR